ncbi:MAG TPA: tetratricopeptide repeat protein [Terriglobia bacterium]|nr:tetratricopeptide repeat protein [Terriglobia bacterium]
MERERTSGAGVVLALLCLTLASAPSARAQHTQHTITDFPQVAVEGTLRMDTAAKQPTGATLTIANSDGEVVDEQSVSTNAQFHFEGLRAGTYVLIATADGYEPYQQTLDLTHSVSRAFVNITLKPASSSALPTGNLPSRTDALAPGKARKEWEKGSHALASRKLDEAQAHFEKAVAAYPCYARAQTDLALTLMREGQSPHAEAPLKKSVECDPDYVDAYLQLGRLLNEQQRFTESRRVLAEGVRRAPSSWDFYFQLGQADFGLKEYPNAEQEYHQAQSFGLAVPSVIHERLAAVYLKESEYSKAYAEMQAYLAEDPDGHYAAGIRTLMQQLQSAGLVHPPD